MSAKLGRRDFMRAAAAATGAAVLAACRPETVVETVIQEVEKEVTKIVQETVIVEGTPQAVEKVITVIPETEGDTGCQMDWNPTFPEYKRYDPPVEITAYLNRYDYPSPEYNEINNPAVWELEEHCGIKLNVVAVAVGEGAVDQQIKADIAAGDLPDMHGYSGTQLEQLIAQDMLEDIMDIWEATASPLVKEKLMWPDGQWWKTVHRGDKLYGVKRCSVAYNGDMICMIRKDWLDQVGLPMPTTPQEWGDAARAWQDAGLCQFGIVMHKHLRCWHHSMDPIFGAYRSMPGYWLPDGKGGLEFGTLRPGTKDALAILHEWYVDGLVDPDFYTYGCLDCEGDVLTEKHGIWTCPWWGHGSDHLDLPVKYPHWDVATMPYPKGPDGHAGRAADNLMGGQYCFRKGLDPVVIEALLNNLNYRVAKHANWVEYQQYGEWRNGGVFVEGWDWQFDENCEVVDGPFPLPYTYKYLGQSLADFTYDRCGYPSYQKDIFEDMAPWFEADPATLNKAQRYLISNPQAEDQARLYSFVYDTAKEAGMPNEFWGISPDSMVQYMGDLNTFQDEVLMNIVVGNEPLDRFDSFVDEWLERGGAEITEDVSAWYRETYS